MAATPRTQAFELMLNVAGSKGSQEGILPLFSPLYMTQAVSNCLRLFMHAISCAFIFAEESVGNSRATRIAITAMTTSNSINVNARRVPMRRIKLPNHLKCKGEIFQLEMTGEPPGSPTGRRQ